MTILLLIWLHFLADFVFQTDRVAINKSSSDKILLWHVFLYSLPFYIFGWMYAAINMSLHFYTDYATSRATKYLWERGERHWFFVVIGLDQAIHMTCLILTMPLIRGYFA